jgi:ATP-dependent protease ClpP protease subunit
MTPTNELLFKPNVRLFGSIDNDAFWSFSEQIEKAKEVEGGAVVLELTTVGGDADVARRIALELRLCKRWHQRQTYFIGKTTVYSAGITIMSAFPPENRYLTEDAVLLIHERRIDSDVKLNGPMRSNIQILREQLSEMETAARLEKEGFEEFVAGSKMTSDQLYERAKTNYYVTAMEALNLGFIGGIV